MDKSLLRVLLIEDDDTFALVLSGYLKNHGFLVEHLSEGTRGVERIMEEMPDAVILDGFLPGKDGFDICKEVRSSYHGIILILTGRSESIDEVLGLEIGADDYLSKPVEPRLILAHLRACLRRLKSGQQPISAQCLEFGGFYISKATRNARLNNKVLELTSTEFDLLWFLASHAGEIVSRDQLFNILRGTVHNGLDRSIDVMISRLRKRLGDDAYQPQRIKTVRSKGYLFNPEDWGSG